ncbi:hypothetical protein D3C81_1897540 [compost metagenome]
MLRQEDIIAIEAVKSLTVKSKLKFMTVDAVYDGRGLISSYASALKNSRFLQIQHSTGILWGLITHSRMGLVCALL